jgi:hypothetical protein
MEKETFYDKAKKLADDVADETNRKSFDCPHTSTVEDWEKDFDTKWMGDFLHGRDLIETGNLVKSYIRSLLHSRDTAIREAVEKLEKYPSKDWGIVVKLSDIRNLSPRY